jgi:HPt (histidine-containing phosphotransfer) domain-containing protein
MISTFLRETTQRLTAMHTAMRQEDGERLASLAHALKGSVSIFGAEQARNHSQSLLGLGHARDFLGAARVYGQLKEEIADLEANLRGYAGQKSSPRAGANPKSTRRSSSSKRKAP